MRQDRVRPSSELRDGLDASWHALLAICDARAVLLPNHPDTAAELIRSCDPAAFILTGGGNIAAISGQRTARDLIESMILDLARRHCKPLLGICRGLQVLVAEDGVAIQPVFGHVRTTHLIRGEGFERKVNSFHDFGTCASLNNYDVLARAPDGVVEMIRHRHLPWLGLGWHPERQRTFDPTDIALLTKAIHGAR